MSDKTKKDDEDNGRNRTEAEVVKPVMASRDEEGAGNESEGLSGTSAAKPADSDEEFEEAVEIEDEAPDYQDQVKDSDDPRLLIGKKFHEKHRAFDESEEKSASKVENDEDTDILQDDDQSADTPPDSDQMVEVKVLGDIRRVPKSKIDAAGGVENYQIRVAAQEQMERNAHERRALDARANEIAEREARIAAQESAVPPSDRPLNSTTDLPVSDGQTIEELAQQYQQAVYEGDESAPQLLTKLVAKAATSNQVSIDPERIKQEAADEFERREQARKVQAATHRLISEHSELDRNSPDYDPRLFAAVDDETTVISRQHPEWEPDQVLTEAFERISNWRGNGQTQPTDSMSEKQQEKRARVRPRAADGRFVKPEAPPPPTKSDYVARVRQSRGQGN